MIKANEIKKALYRDNIDARLLSVSKNGIYYHCLLNEPIDGIKGITFLVPLDDIGDGKFHVEMPAKLLIRYLTKP